MKRKIGQTLAIALTVLAVSPALAQDGPMDDPEGPTGMDGMQMGQGTMQDDMMQDEMMQGGMMQGGMMQMMQMMSHCMSMMEQMHGDNEGMGEMNGMNGMGMPGMMESNRPASGFDAATAEALARAFVRGQAPDNAEPVEVVGVTVEGNNFLVEYRQGNSQGTLLVDSETGEVTDAEDR